MSIFSGPEITQNGLVLAYDGGNTKSFKGEPTTNIVTNASTMTGWNSYEFGNDGTFTTEFGTTGYRIINRGSWNGISRSITLPSTGTYTLSAWFRYWGGAADNNGATVYSSGGGIGDTAAGINKSIIGTWQRISMTNTYSTTGMTFYIISYGGTYGGSNSSWEVTMPQIEAKSYATTFVNGTRGATVATGGGWADLSGNNIHGQLIGGVTESSSNGGSLVFNGSTGYSGSGALTGSFSTFTVIVWFYPTSVSNYQNVIDCNYAYNGSTGNLGPRLEMNSTGNLAWAYSQDTSVNNNFYMHNVVSSGLAANTWHCAAITYTPNTSTTYYNGNATGLSRVVNGSPTGFLGTMNNVNLGRGFSLGGAERWFSGRVSNVQIYNRALSATEVAQNFNALRGRYGI